MPDTIRCKPSLMRAILIGLSSSDNDRNSFSFCHRARLEQSLDSRVWAHSLLELANSNEYNIIVNYTHQDKDYAHDQNKACDTAIRECGVIVKDIMKES